VLKIRFQIQNLTGQATQYRNIAHAVQSIVRDEGIRAFWKGNLPAELMVIPFGAVSFVSYNAMKQWILANPSTSTASSATISLASGSFSGMCATVATYPLDLLRTRLAAQREPKIYPTMSSAVVYILRNEGARGLYAGMWPTLVGIVPYMALQFASYEALKTAALQLNRSVDPTCSSQLSPTQHGACGFLAGMSSKLLTMPLDVVKKRFQVDAFPFQQTCQDPTHHHGTNSHTNVNNSNSHKNGSLLGSKPAPSLSAAMSGVGVHSVNGSGGGGGSVGGVGGSVGGVGGIGGVSVGAGGAAPEPHLQCVTPIALRARYKGLIDCMSRIYASEGVAGLFRGTVPSLIKAGPNSAITFVMYESCIRFMLRMRPTLDER